jgi:hypothetical protein
MTFQVSQVTSALCTVQTQPSALYLLSENKTESTEQGAPKEKKKSDVGTMAPFLRFFAVFRFDFRKYFLWCFWAPHAEKRPKNAIKENRWEKTTGKCFFSQLFRPKAFDMDFPQKVLYSVFELPLLRNAQKRNGKR